MVGIHWYGYGNWEKIRLDPKLGLATKIAPATLGERETFLPRAPNLDNRASALLQKVLTHLHLFLSYNLVWIFIVSQVTVMQIKMEILNAS
jgi:hypothetical protein